MNWQLLITVSIFAYALAVTTQRVLMKNDKSDPVSYSVVFQLVTGLIISFFGFLTADMSIPPLKPLLLNLAIMTCLYGAANIFGFKALKKIEASEFTIIFATRALFTIIASTILLKEGLHSIQFLGAFLILLSVLIATFKSLKIRFSEGELLTLGAALCMGLAVTNDRYLLGSFHVYPYVTLAFILPALLVGVLNLSKMKKITTLLNKNTLSKMLLMCIFYSVSSITFFGALQIGNNSSQIAILNLVSIILIVIFGTLFLNEKKDIFKKIIAAVLSIVGSIILIK